MKLFSPYSFWNLPIAPWGVVDPNSPAMISDLLAVNKTTAPWFNTTAIVEVPPGQPTMNIGYAAGAGTLAAAFSGVPFYTPITPTDTDLDLAVVQPSTNTMWEFFELTKPATGWTAEWGGCMQNVSASQGVYGPTAFPGATVDWGVRATGFPVAAGVITNDDLLAGVINHALVAVVPFARSGVFNPPAVRSDGTNTDPNSLPEGAWLRLNPTLNLASLTMPALTRMIAVAAQTYGIYIGDQSHHAFGLYLQDPNGSAWAQELGNVYFGSLNSGELLSYFPWASLQVMTLDLQT